MAVIENTVADFILDYSYNKVTHKEFIEFILENYSGDELENIMSNYQSNFREFCVIRAHEAAKEFFGNKYEE